jgi:uncharacterized protein
MDEPNMLKRALVLIAILVAAPWADALPTDQAKHRDIEKLVDMMGTVQNATTVIDRMLPQMIDVIRKSNPEIPQTVLDALEADGKDEFHKAIPELIEPIIAIYDSNYSAEEVRQLLAFYESPIGRKLIQQMPQIMQQSLALGASWGQSIGERVADRMRVSAKQKGYDL